MKPFNIAIDGPSGAGKSSLADALAAKYGLVHLDTGAMYRAVAVALDEKEISPISSPRLQEVLNTIDLKMDKDQVILNGQDVSQKIRTARISLLASKYSALPEVRQKLVHLQQKITASKGFIVDGRDICDVVLPDAEVKIYLDASPEARAMRRQLQDAQKGQIIPYEKVLEDILKRDEQDMNRKEAPLRKSKQATLIDSSDLDFAQTVKALEDVVEKTLTSNSIKN